jgi:hypothetical protein
MEQFDREYAERRKEVQPQIVSIFEQQGQDKDEIAKYVATLNSPEMQAGSALMVGAIQCFVVLALSAGGGAFAGMMRDARAQRLGRRSD